MGSSKVRLPPAPAAVLANPQQENATAVGLDKAYYGAADADYAARFPELVAADRAVRSQVAQEATSGELPASVQHQLALAGLTQAFRSSGSVAPGSIGGYSVGRDLGVGTINYEDSRRKALADLLVANPERAFGLTGHEGVNLDLENIKTENAVKQQGFAAAAQAAISDANRSSSIFGAGIGAAGSILGGAFTLF